MPKTIESPLGFPLRHAFAGAAAPDLSGAALRQICAKRPPRDTAHDNLAMFNYMNGLHFRLGEHLRKHAPRWHAKETTSILARWSAPGLHHPRPPGVVPRDMLVEARDYAGALVRGRLAARLHKIHAIDVARRFDGQNSPDPLDRLLPGTPMLSRSFRQKV